MYQNIRERKKVAALCGYQFINFKKIKSFTNKNPKHFIPWGWATWVKIGKILEKIHFKL